MYTVIFSPKAANQYADIIDFLSAGPKKLTTFEKEIESAIRRLERMPESYPYKGKLRAARLVKSEYYLFYRIEDHSQQVVVVLIISQKADSSKWPK